MEKKLSGSFQILQEKGFYCSVSENEWEHHFENTNYRLLETMTKIDFENSLSNNKFIKLAHKIPLHHWNDAEETLLGSFKQLIKIMAD